ncbi:hypothetical protein, partial [Niastella populi]|uniref:hypothetical protein n=1 Tax=Niastella populi TaxID=550983 RepID=UPI001A9915BC
MGNYLYSVDPGHNTPILIFVQRYGKTEAGKKALISRGANFGRALSYITGYLIFHNGTFSYENGASPYENTLFSYENGTLSY